MVYNIKFLFNVGYYFIINNCNKNCRYVNKIELYYKVRVYVKSFVLLVLVSKYNWKSIWK